MQVRALHAYSAASEAELSLTPDEHLTLVEGDADGWVVCQTLDGQRQGFVPTNYVVLADAVAEDDGDSVVSHGSFTTVAPSRANQPSVQAAKALGVQLAGHLAAATSQDALPGGAAAANSPQDANLTPVCRG